MTEAVVTRRGQTTIPAEMRRKHRISEGTRLEFIDAGDAIVIRKKPSTADLIGSGASDLRRIYRMLDKMREEDDYQRKGGV
jgi:AbrB family looped-hinge helix DNA binding protein